MSTEYYLALNHWLQRADWNHLGGRVILHNYLLTEECNLFWLSNEQALNTLVFQDNIMEIGLTYKDIDAVYTVLEKEGNSFSEVVAIE